LAVEKHDEQGLVDSCVESILRIRGRGVESEIEDDGYAPAIKRLGGNVRWGEFAARGNEERYEFWGFHEVKGPTIIGREGRTCEAKSVGSRNASAKHKENAGGGAEAALCDGAFQDFLKSYDLAVDIKEEDERGFEGATMKPIPNVLQSGKMVQILMAASEPRVQPRKEYGAMQHAGTGEGSAEQTGGCFERSPIFTGSEIRARGTRFQLLPQAC
jgi:hypothetical protein